MSIINKNYICKETKVNHGKNHYRNNFLVKCKGDKGSLIIYLGFVHFPKELEGKRVRFKLEVYDDEKKEYI